MVRIAPPEADALDQARDALVATRRKLLGELAGVDADLRALAEEREIELEERSQEEAAADVLARLSDRDVGKLRDIDAALDRIAAGTYGTCTACGGAIAIGRLRAVPTTPLCGACASASGGGRPQPPVHEPSLRTATVLPDIDALEDGEVAVLVREVFRDKGGGGLDSVHVSCRYGVVTLRGWVPSEELRALALDIAEDEFGLEVVDRLGVSALAMMPHRKAAAPAKPAGENAIIEVMAAGTESSEDIFEAEGEGIEYRPRHG